MLDEGNGLMQLNLARDVSVLAYAKENHIPATFTILNFPVAADVEDAVENLGQGRGPRTVRRQGSRRSGDRSRTGPEIAWCKDPAGNILSVLEQA